LQNIEEAQPQRTHWAGYKAGFASLHGEFYQKPAIRALDLKAAGNSLLPSFPSLFFLLRGIVEAEEKTFITTKCLLDCEAGCV
jgi:hypothetical protein